VEQAFVAGEAIHETTRKVTLETRGKRWHVSIPDKLRTDHETHFGQVMTRFLAFLREGKLPAWETPNTIAKYYTTIKALEMATVLQNRER